MPERPCDEMQITSTPCRAAHWASVFAARRHARRGRGRAGVACSGASACSEREERGLVDLGILFDDVDDVHVAIGGGERERVGDGAVGELATDRWRPGRARTWGTVIVARLRVRRHAHDRLGRVVDDHRGHGAEPAEAGLLAGADDDRVDALVARELDARDRRSGRGRGAGGRRCWRPSHRSSR